MANCSLMSNSCSPLRSFAVAVALVCTFGAAAQSIFTVAGGGGGSIDGRQAKSVPLRGVDGLAFDGAGNLYISESDGHAIQRVDLRTGIITTFAGTGGGTYGGDNGSPRLASLNNPQGIVFDPAGNLYIADNGNDRIRKIDAATGLITTFAGGGTNGEGDGGTAIEAEVLDPVGLAWHDGSLYVTQISYERHRVRKIAANGIITTVAGAGPSGAEGDGGLATAAKLAEPWAVALDATGNLFIADRANGRVRRVDAVTKNIDTIVGGGNPADQVGNNVPGTEARIFSPTGLVFGADGKLYITDNPDRGRVRRYDPVSKIVTSVMGSGEYSGGDGRPAIEAGLWSPHTLVFDRARNLFVHDAANNTVRRIDATTTIVETVAGGGTFVGDGLLATNALLNRPHGLAVDASGHLYIADSFHTLLRKVDATTGIISTHAGLLNTPYGAEEGKPATETSVGGIADVAIHPLTGELYLSNPHSESIWRIDGQGKMRRVAGGGSPADGVGDGPDPLAAKLNAGGISFDRQGNLYIADSNPYSTPEHHRIRKVDAQTKAISTIAGGTTRGYSGDNNQASAAQLDSPSHAVADASGNIFISDSGNQAVRRIDGITGVITTYAGRGTPPEGIGDGLVATSAVLGPERMAIDKATGDLLVADNSHHRIRRISARTQVITTVAGSATSYLDPDFAGDNGPATEARLNIQYDSSGVATDAAGNVYLSDTLNDRVRIVRACTTVAIPILSGPAEGATGVTSATLTWNKAANALRYDVLLDTVSPPVKVAASDFDGTSFAPANLNPSTKYYWSVIARGDPFCTPISTAASATRSFTTAGTCAAGPFETLSPAEDAVVTTQTVALSWNASAGSSAYDLYLGTVNPPPLVAADLTGTTYTAAVTPGNYFWFVQARASCDRSRTASTAMRKFLVSGQVNCQSPVPIVTPIAPANGATSVSTSVELTWSSAGPFTGFDLYFGTSSPPPLLSADLSAKSQRLTGLVPGTKYYWRVVGKGPCSQTGTASSTVSFTTRSCGLPGATSILFAPDNVSAGATYTVIWSAAEGLDIDGGYLLERSTSPSFTSITDSQVSGSTAASFIAANTGTYYHRVRAVAACDPTRGGPLSEVRGVNVVNARPNVVFTVQPSSAITDLNEGLDAKRGAFTLENLGATPLQVIVGRQELAGSPPFFSIVDPQGADSAFVTLEPRQPRTFEIRYAGPRTDQPGSYQGVIFVASTGQGLAVTPYAFVNLKVGGAATATPQFLVNGVPSDYAAFPAFSGDDANRPSIQVSVKNPGSSPMELAAEIGPEVWLVPEGTWNKEPIAPGATRTINLTTRRSRAPNGSALPRYTYFVARTKDGASARLLVQDSDQLAVQSGRSSRLDAGSTSFVIPDAVSKTNSGGARVVTRMRLSNIGSDSVQVEMIATPAGADGFDAAKVKRAVVLVPPNDVVTLTDPLSQIFGLASPVEGQIELRIPLERLGLITASSSTLTIGSSGGFAIPTVSRGEGARAGSDHLLLGVTSSATVTTSMILAETTGIEATSVRARLLDSSGNPTGVEKTTAVPRYGSVRIDDVVSFLGGTNVSNGRVRLEVASGGGSVVALALVGPAGTDGGASLLSRPAAEREPGASLLGALWKRNTDDTTTKVTMVVPVLGAGTSSNAFYKTSLAFSANPGLASTFNAIFRLLDGTVAATRAVSVPAGSITTYNDAAVELFGLTPGTAGSVSVEEPAGAKVSAVLLSSATASGTPTPVTSIPLPTSLSQAITGNVSWAQRPLFLDGLEQSTDPTRGSRWLLLLNEVGGASGSVNVFLYEAGNRTVPIGAKTVTIGANQQRQLVTVFGELGLDSAGRRKDRTNVQCVVMAAGGSARVTATAVAIDNQSGDTKLHLLTPSTGSSWSVSVVTPVLPPATPGKRRSVRK